MGDATLFFLLGARGVIRDERSRVLLIKHTDNGYWAFPAGAMELGESMRRLRDPGDVRGDRAEGQARRRCLAFLSGPQYTFTNVFGDTYQHISGSYLLDRGVHGELTPEPGRGRRRGLVHPGQTCPSRPRGAVRWTLDHLARFRTDRPDLLRLSAIMACRDRASPGSIGAH